MMFPPWLFGRIGYSLCELQHADERDEREDYIQDVESHTAAKSRTLEEEYKKLSTAYSQLRDYTAGVEKERTALLQENRRLREGLDDLRKIEDRFNEESASIREQMEKLKLQSTNLSYAYNRVKRVLTLFSDHSDLVFGEGFPISHRESLIKFLKSLP
ncbi:MAG: hypothetical protein WAN11_19440 [Syntrophobacteraceae bacterium]